MSSITSEDLVKSLTSDAYNYYCSAKKYYIENELEGALINFLLALNNLKSVKKALDPTKYTEALDTWRAETATAARQCQGEQCLAVPAASCDLKDIQEGTDKAIAKILSYVRPLQEQLKRIKNERAFGQKKADEEVPCKDVKQVLLQGDDAAITFDDVSGQEEPKNQIRNSILYPLLYPRLFPNLSKGILFYGPPGTGKTLLARAFVNQLQLEADKADSGVGGVGGGIRIILYAPKGSDLKGKYVGETEKKISAYFKCASAAATSCAAETANKVVSVIFIDEVEAIAGNRSEDAIMTTSVNALLQEMDGVVGNPNVVVMAATNYPWKLDEAVLRRFDTKIYIKLPTAADIIVSIKTEFTNKFIKKALKATVGGGGTKKKAAAAAADIDPSLVLSELETKCAGAGSEMCHNDTVCLTKFAGPSTALTPVEIFNFYREKYFSKLNDASLLSFAKQLEQLLFSGGDVSNLCKKVFKSMGDEARRNGRFTPTNMPDPTKLTDSVKSVCGGDFIFHLFDPQNGISTNTDELEESKCIVLHNEDDLYSTDNENNMTQQAIISWTSDDILSKKSSDNTKDTFVDLDCVPYHQFGPFSDIVNDLCSNISALLNSCKNNTQKCFYVSLEDLRDVRDKAAPPPPIRILIKQVLNINSKISVFNIKKDIFVLIKLTNKVENPWYNPFNVAGKVQGAIESVMSWSWLNFMKPVPITFDMRSKDENDKKYYYDKLNALKAAPEAQMEQIYQQATHVLCLEEQHSNADKAKTRAFTLSTMNIEDNIGKFYKCLSRGELLNETTCTSLIPMFKIIQQEVMKQKEDSPLRRIINETPKTLNELVYYSGMLAPQYFSNITNDEGTTSSGLSGQLNYKFLLPSLKLPEFINEFEIDPSEVGLGERKLDGDDDVVADVVDADVADDDSFSYNMLFMIKDIDSTMAAELMAKKVRDYIDQGKGDGKFALVPEESELSYDDTRQVICKIGDIWYQAFTFSNLTELSPSRAMLMIDKSSLMYEMTLTVSNENHTKCVEEETDATRKITLNASMKMFLDGINYGANNVGSVKPTVQIETIQALNDYAANIKKK
jgi:SpoVK/Ycf46/Vps4 family AAA+-type ATPase